MTNNIVELFDKYIGECRYTKRLRAETVRGYSAVFKTFTKIMPEVVSTKDLNKETINLFFKRVETRERVIGRNTIKRGVKNSTIHTYWSKLNCFFAWLKVNGYIDGSFTESIKPAEPIYEDSRALSKDEIQRIITAIISQSKNILISKRDILMVTILTFCGLRKGELISLLVSDFNESNRTLTIRGETSKSKKTRELPLNSTVLMQFRDYIKERNSCNYKTPYLFVSSTEDVGLSVHGLKHWVARLVSVSGVKFHLHRFRHTFAVNLCKHGTDVVAIQKLLGHAQLKMTQVYLRSAKPEDFRRDVDKLNYSNLI